MEKIKPMMPLFILALFILFTANYFLKKDKKDKKNNLGKTNSGSEMDFNRYINIKTKYAKIFSIIIIVFIILKIFFILFVK
jgi:energy-coupling factor transporter transmembrane protein EcfT